MSEERVAVMMACTVFGAVSLIISGAMADSGYWFKALSFLVLAACLGGGLMWSAKS